MYLLHCVPRVVFIYRFHCASTTTMCPLGGLYIQVLLYINYVLHCVPWVIFIYRFYCTSTTYYIVSLGWLLYTGSTAHQLLQCVPWVVFIYRFHCTSTTTLCPLGGLYIQVPLYINYYIDSLGWSLYTGSTVHQLLQCVQIYVMYIMYKYTYMYVDICADA